MAKRDEEKKRRRQRRLQKRRQNPLPAPGLSPELDRLRQLKQMLSVPPPATFPGGRDPSLARPDVVKFEFATWATAQEPGRSKSRHMENGARRGPLGDLLELADHWIIEEFLWHGAPGDDWHPLDAFLGQAGARFSPAAAEQLRLWKAAEIGLFEIGEVQGDTVTFQAWDPIQAAHASRPLRAISLNIGGVQAYRQMPGAITFTYLAPWVPADNLYCAMGYGKTLAKRDVAMLVPYLGLRHPKVVCRPLPWKRQRADADDYLRQWRQREWQSWLRERLQFPFWALVGTPPDGKPELLQVTELIPSTPLQAQQMGIYMAVPFEGAALAAGATMVEPIDVTSPNHLALAEYRAYRDCVGPPPGTRGMPLFTGVR
jgi:hypothetical protein